MIKRAGMLAASFLVMAASAVTPATAEETVGYDVVATNLDSPRGLSFAPNGDLYIAESGAPSPNADQCTAHPEFETVCLAATGAITKLSRHGVQSRAVSGLPVLVSEGEAIGPSDVVIRGNTLSIAMGLGGDAATRDALGGRAALLGTVLDVKLLGNGPRYSVRADLAAHENTNPDGGVVDSNPVSLALRGAGLVAVDAGGNSVLLVGNQGGVTANLAVLDVRGVKPPPPPPGEDPLPDPFPMEPVPTAVAQGPDGAWYISELTGFPFPPGEARIYRLADGELSIWATGLTNVTDLAWHGDQLYAVQIADRGLLAGDLMGSLVHVDRSGNHQTVLDGLFAPYGLAIRDGAAYVSVNSVVPGGGEVYRVPLG